jgi:two-component system response regulator DesR
MQQSSPRTRILVVEDHPAMRESVCSLLEREPDLEVCGQAASAETALDAIADVRPDVALVDVSLPDVSGIELAAEITRRDPDVVVVMLSGHREPSYVAQAVEAGAGGYILKGRGAEIADAVRRVVAGERYLSPSLRLRPAVDRRGTAAGRSVDG